VVEAVMFLKSAAAAVFSTAKRRCAPHIALASHSRNFSTRQAAAQE
jgi:hypothetical protein